MSYIAWVITNLFIQAYGKKGAPPAKFENYLFKWGETEEMRKMQSVEEMKSVLEALAASQDRKVGKEARRVRTIPTKKIEQ